MQGFTYCGPREEKCVANQTLRDKNCLIPCTGLFADIMDDSFEKYVIKGMILISSLSCFFDPHTYKQGFHTLTDELAGYSTKDRLHLALQQMLPLLARDGGDGVGLIGGTMGLLTGFSILSGVEIIFHLFRCFLLCNKLFTQFSGSSCLSGSPEL